jgi:hypothetical protein
MIDWINASCLECFDNKSLSKHLPGAIDVCRDYCESVYAYFLCYALLTDVLPLVLNWFKDLYIKWLTLVSYLGCLDGKQIIMTSRSSWSSS